MFVHTALTWGFFLALVPLLIHLINLVRRRRVRWAAMDFLLQSYKKHQKWIWLQQLLLLLMRMIAVALAVAMLAQWIAKSHWFNLFGGQVTHHYVLLDDTFSMSEKFGGMTAFDKATQALGRVAAQAMAQESPQKLTLIRFSRAAGFRKDDTGTAIGQLADLNAEAVDPNFDVLLEDKRRSLAVTQLAMGPRLALELANELLRQNQDDSRVVHVLSDFRTKDWSDPAQLKPLVSEIDEVSEQIHFVNCAPESEQANLAITSFQPADEIRAAGVPFPMTATVKNFGTTPARNVPLRIRTTFFDPQTMSASEPGRPEGKIDEPPSVLIDEIPAGQTVTRQVSVLFPQPGQHVVEGILPEDVVATDNRRWSVVDILDRELVLIVDGDPAQRNAYYLQSAFEPGPRATTGVRSEVKGPSFLRDTTLESLRTYSAIYLLDVDRLDDRAAENLEAFVRGGGGVGFFLGDRVNMSYYTTRLYRDGAGLFPVPVERAEVLPVNPDEDVPDLDVLDHPLFSVFFGERNPFIRLVNVDRYLRPPLSWSAPSNSTVSVIAQLRNRQPLAVEHKFGEGRVVVFLTSLAPDWNNWANEPSFVVVMLKLQSYLAAPLRMTESRTVGVPLDYPIDSEKIRKDLVFVAPGPKSELPLVLQRAAVAEPQIDDPTKKDNQKNKTDAIVERLRAVLPGISDDDANTMRSGIYELWQTTVAGPRETRRFAVNVDPSESNITQMSAQTLTASLAPVRIRMRRADELAFDLTEQAGFNRSTWLMVVLVGVLIGEQLLAYAASYHPVATKGVVRA